MTRLSHGYGIALLILVLVMTGVLWWRLPPEIPLFYSMPYGPSQLAPKIAFLLLPGSAIILFSVSQLFSRLRIGSVLLGPMMGWLQTMGLFLVGLAMFHLMMMAI